MGQAITDPEVRLLASIAATLRGDYTATRQADLWRGSPFEWIRTLPSRQRGKIGEQLISGWCAAKGLDVTASGDSEADRVIGGWRIEVKFSTLWASGVYTFQQIRDQRYDYLICLGLAPYDARSWLVSKALLKQHVIGHTPQHRGAAGRDTFWLSFRAPEPPSWLSRCGGTLGRTLELLQTIKK